MAVALASNPADIRDNAERFLIELPKSPELQANLAYFRAWYAFRRHDGSWVLGPSKFIGYDGMTAPIYLAAAKNLNGRATEAHLQRWFKPVSEHSPLHTTLMNKLYGLLGQYNKGPNTTTRLSVLNADAEAEIEALDGEGSALVKLLVEVARSLKPSERHGLKAAIASL